ncbi:ankyrin repeat domain-containing protein [Pontibacter ruber]|uniref:Ankyrin repeat domain-containing protein n=1 Tax=Pontibacter ruber TaxID=1343895 RepID=A0ABW5CVH3_9BACT|nr:ankyrin repeat domain-containing protein [Pontibacter ruber]
MKKIFLLLVLLPLLQGGMAQTKTQKPHGTTKSTQVTKKKATATKPAAKPKTASKSAATKPAAAKPASAPAKAAPAQQPAAAPSKPKVQHWSSPELQEAVDLYTSLKFDSAYVKFKEAAAKGQADALYFMGRLHQYRELDPDSVQSDTLRLQDPEKYAKAYNDSARYYYEQAVDNNSYLGNLGIAELMILRTPEDKQKFLKLMRTAAVDIRDKAVAGDAFCNRILGSMYYTGYGEMMDKELAFNYIRKAANKGDVVSYVSLANLYLEGEGVEKDNDKAVFWLKKGVEAGEREAIYTLGLLHEEGTIGEPDLNEARRLYKLAIAKGSQNAYYQLKYINQTPDQKLVIASITRNTEMLKRALNAGADVNTLAVPDDFSDMDLRGRTPLMHVLYIPMLLEEYGVIYEPEVRPAAVSQLLAKGAKVNATDKDGKTALHYIVASSRVNSRLYEIEQVQLLDTLLQRGADPNHADVEGNAVLAQALTSTIGQHIGIMELEKLLAAKANPNQQNKEGKTPLMLACEINASSEIIMALLNAGADPKLRDAAGKAAIDYTKQENVQNILMAAGSPERKI